MAENHRAFPLQTVAQPASWKGRGLHSGSEVAVRVHPGHSGIHFRWGDERIEATAANVVQTQRCTQLGPIATIEHLMATFAALQITDAEVELTAPELPALDGSALPYFEGLSAAGVVEIGTQTVSGPFARLYVKQGDAKVAIGEGEGKWQYRLVCQGRWPGRQDFEMELDEGAAFGSEVAPARTWGFAEEVERILASGLAKGLDSRSALIIGQTDYENTPRFPDEPARHKWLDLLGDLYLSGVPCRHLNVTATRGGHALHVRAARLLAESVQIERRLS